MQLAGSNARPREVRRVDLLRRFLAVHRPDEPAVIRIDPEIGFGESIGLVGCGIEETARIGWCSIVGPPCRLMVERVPHLLVDHPLRWRRREAVDVRIEDRGHGPLTR